MASTFALVALLILKNKVLLKARLISSITMLPFTLSSLFTVKTAVAFCSISMAVFAIRFSLLNKEIGMFFSGFPWLETCAVSSMFNGVLLEMYKLSIDRLLEFTGFN